MSTHLVVARRIFRYLALLSLAAPALAQCELVELSGPNPEPLDVFGWSVALDGTVAAIGMIGADDLCPTNPNCDSGAAYVYELGGGGWAFSQALAASDGAPGDQFGQCVDVSGDRLIVGAHLKLEGAAYVYQRSGGAWIEEQKLVGSDSQPFFHFGHSVALDDDVAVVGVMRDDHAGQEAGSAFVFLRGATNWVEAAKLVASDAAAGDRFGRSCDLDGDVVVIGAHTHDHGLANSGAAYVYERDDNGTPQDPLDDTWPQVAELRASAPLAGALYGRSVGVAGDTLVVGASMDVEAGIAMGVAYVYERVAGTWTLVQRLVPSDGVAGDQFGESVALEGDRLIVGAVLQSQAGHAAGGAYVFERTPTGWVETMQLRPAAAATGDVLGAENTVAVCGATALAAAPLSSRLVDRAGVAYIFDLAGCLGERYCVAAPNSTGVVGETTAAGSLLVHQNDLRLTASDLPLNAFGYFLFSRLDGFVSMPGGSSGNLCLGAPIGRYQVALFNTGASGSGALQLDLAQLPTPTGPTSASPGDTLRFQAWHRDSVGGAATSNFTAGLSLTVR